MITIVVPGGRRRRAVITTGTALTAVTALAITAFVIVAPPGRAAGHHTVTLVDKPVIVGASTAASHRPDMAGGDVTPPGRAPLPATSMPQSRVSTGLASARGPLHRLATTLTTSTEEHQAGPVEYVRELQWVASTAVADRRATVTIRPIIVERWWARDRSGRVRTSEYPPGTNLLAPGARRAHVDATAYGPGRLAGPVVLPGDAAGVAALLRTTTARPDTAGVLDAVVQLYSTRVPSLTTRAAVLQVLADADLDWRGHTTDRTGTDTLTVSADVRGGESSAVTRLLMRLDPRTGVVTGFERVLLTNPGNLSGPFPQTHDLRVFVAHRRQTTLADSGPPVT